MLCIDNALYKSSVMSVLSVQNGDLLHCTCRTRLINIITAKIICSVAISYTVRMLTLNVQFWLSSHAVVLTVFTTLLC